MSGPERPSLLKSVALRLATILFPPLGLVLLWRSGKSLSKKLLGTSGILLFCLPYLALVILLLIRFAGLQVEWRGGYIPALTWTPTAPDYDKLEQSRAQQAKPSPTKAEPAAQSSYWTGFRGPIRDGHYREMPILTNWLANGLRETWRQPCGGGYASFAIAAGLAFTIEQRREQEVVTAYDLETGREVWTHGWNAHFSEAMGGDGPRATPVHDEGRLFALGAEGELRCLDARSGTPVWSKNILTESGFRVPIYGASASPLVVEEKLIVLAGGEHGGAVLCYRKQDGERLWILPDTSPGYAAPMLVELGGERQLMVCMKTETTGLKLDDGTVRWRFPWRVLNNQMPIAQPVRLATNQFLLSGGYFTGCAAFEVSGNGDSFSTQELWRSKGLKNKFTSSVVWEGHVYGLDEDILTCLDATTGERKWKDGRYGYGQLLLASSHLVILCGNGDLALVKATPERHLEIARFSAIRGKTWNHPAIGGGRLLVRNGAEMACFEIGNRD
jgi:outer membrane protein assembly factor BamB